MKKRLISTLLVLCMVLGMLPGTALAADDDFTVENGVLTKYSGSGGNVIIPDGITRIGSGAFAKCDNLISVTIPNGVTTIGSGAFAICESLISITMPSGVTSIGSEAFAHCSSLTSITMPSGVTSIGSEAFAHCSSLTSIAIPDSVTSIGYGAFSECTSLIKVTIPSSLTSIERETFYNCDSLTSVTIPNGVTSIGNQAFAYCDRLINVSIPNSVTNIGLGAFMFCGAIENITIPNSVTNIGPAAFECCASLTGINIPNSITSLEADLFGSCISLTSITIPENVTFIDYNVFSSCNSLTKITIPSSVTNIGVAAFNGCTALTDVYYSGTKEQRDTISIGQSNDSLTTATIHYHNTKFSFSYSLDGGSWSLPDECYTYSAGEKITIPSEMPLKDGCYFAGWSDGIKTYQPGSTYTMPNHDVELTAIWGIGPLNLISIARDNITVTESYTAAPRYTLADGATVEWTSADPSIAAVDSNGVVTGVHYGKTAITAVATAAGAKQTVSYPVTVNPNYKISFTNAVVHLAPGKSTDLFCSVLPLDGQDHIRFQSNKPEIVSVSGNTITAVGEGSATITASFDPAWLAEFPCEIPPVATCDVTVSNWEELANEFAAIARSYVGKDRAYFKNEKGYTESGDWCGHFAHWCATEVGAGNIINGENCTPMVKNILKTGGEVFYFSDYPVKYLQSAIREIVSATYPLAERDAMINEYTTRTHMIGEGEQFIPQIGDVFFLNVHGKASGHIGIVTGYEKDSNNNIIGIQATNGNFHNIVCGVSCPNKKCNEKGQIINLDGTCAWGKSYSVHAYMRPNWTVADGVKAGPRDDKYKCPIDVRYLYDGETLDSATEQFVASFGTMERTDDGGILVHLNNYYDNVDITINGTGIGTMDITSTFRDSDGAISTRKFQGVPITEETIGKLFVYDSAATEILEIYKDNGNTFVEAWAADGNTTVSSADRDLTDWYLNGDTTDAGADSSNISTPSDSPAETTPVDEAYLFPFTDVLKTDWFCNAVEYVFTNDLMSGTAPYTFDPQGKMNRAMVWTVLGRMADADVDGSESPWYSKAQAWAMSNNVSDGTNPTNSISRQELMTMLWRYIGSPATTADLNKFSDSESVADWADDAMQWAVSTGLIVGDNGRLNPTGDARRCEVAMIFMRYCENSVE